MLVNLREALSFSNRPHGRERNANKPEKKVKRYIYHLIDPRNQEVFYVGQTVDPAARLKEHVTGSSPAARRIDEIIGAGQIPVMKTVASLIGTRNEALAVEEAEIRKFSREQLLNTRGFRRSRA